MLQKHETVQTIATACCVLHNVLIDMDPTGVQALLDVEDPNTHDVRPGAWMQEIGLVELNVGPGNKTHEDGKKMRDYLTTYYNSKAGSVPWQDGMV